MCFLHLFAIQVYDAILEAETDLKTTTTKKEQQEEEKRK